jgi:hypothetical protein
VSRPPPPSNFWRWRVSSNNYKVMGWLVVACPAGVKPSLPPGPVSSWNTPLPWMDLRALCCRVLCGGARGWVRCEVQIVSVQGRRLPDGGISVEIGPGFCWEEATGQGSRVRVGGTELELNNEKLCRGENGRVLVLVL